jgi:tRNA threonylcarbamoyladenosine biosynthesis protein TsaB
MRLLGLDSSSENLSIGAVDSGKVIFKFSRGLERGASKAIMYIERLLKKNSLLLSDFDCLVVGAGPGSFTGLRISFSIVKGFSISLGKPVIALGSFSSVAEKVKKVSSRIAVISDAKRGLIYAATFVAMDNTLVNKEKENLYLLEDFLKKHREYLFVTYHSWLREKAKKILPYINFYSKDVWPDVISLMRVAQILYQKGKFTPLEKLEPFYIYPKECQIREVSNW